MHFNNRLRISAGCRQPPDSCRFLPIPAETAEFRAVDGAVDGAVGGGRY